MMKNIKDCCLKKTCDFDGGATTKSWENGRVLSFDTKKKIGGATLGLISRFTRINVGTVSSLLPLGLIYHGLPFRQRPW